MEPGSSGCDIINSRTYLHPRERVFEAFSDPVRLARWWGPKGFTNSFHTFDFQPGGQWQLTMYSPDGHDFKNECVFQEITMPGRIVIEHVSAPKYVLAVTLEKAGDGTRLLWVQRFE
ncbi:SRPBCC domain-containing protein [Prosthecobacter sp. SYSU 5D2]|uniref:SRPBCC domain-containing protein n=1 Tax=Prosthecobacter sp. SYSU 5D2 TaxID=3134134 RepID=UPI0031FF0FBA